MNKGALVGAGAGLLVLAFLGGYWLALSDNAGTASTTTVEAQPAPAPLSSSANTSPAAADTPSTTAPGADTAAPAGAGAAPASAQGERSKLTPEERKKVRAAIRAKMNELMARKSDMSIEDLRKFVEDLKAVSQGELEPEFLERMGQMFERTEQVNQLGQELKKVADSQAPQDRQRQREILNEMESLSQQIRLDAAAMQAIGQQRLASRRAEIAERRAKREAAQAEAAKAMQESAK